MSDKEVLIQVENLEKSFGDHQVIKGISTTISRGDVVAVIGPSGCGKSTFLRSMNCLEEPTAGRITFEGTDITDEDVDINLVREKIGMVFQQFNLFPNMTVKENIMLAPVKRKKMTKEEAAVKAEELLNRIGLADKADTYPAMLSGGQKQRICIARALLKKPKILILDDSTSAVDTATDAKIRKAFAEEIPGTTKIIIAQRISSVSGCDRIIVMEDGQVDGFDTHKNLIENNQIYREVYESQTGGGSGDFDEEGKE